MMKKIFTIITFLVITFMAKAQNYEYVGPFGMPYFSVNVGGVSSMNVETLGTFVDGFKPSASVELGTWITPIYSISLVGYGTINPSTFNEKLPFSQTNFVGLSKVNFSNFFGGYKGYPRRVEVVGASGFGWGHEYGETVQYRNYLTYNLGGELNVNLGKSRNVQINFKPLASWRLYNEYVTLNRTRGMFVAQVGFTYKFGNHRVSSHNFVVNNYSVEQRDYDALRDELRNKPVVVSSPEVQIKEVEVVKEKVVHDGVIENYKYIEVPINLIEKQYFTFDINSTVLSPTEEAKLKEFAKYIANDVAVKIVGSADSSTGTEVRNQKLAESRAEMVKNKLLYEYKVAANKFIVTTKIDAGTTPELSRSVTISLQPIDVD